MTVTGYSSAKLVTGSVALATYASKRPLCELHGLEKLVMVNLMK
jgi:hypothetical protein